LTKLSSPEGGVTSTQSGSTVTAREAGMQIGGDAAGLATNPDPALELSSQSVEIISHEESLLLQQEVPSAEVPGSTSAKGQLRAAGGVAAKGAETQVVIENTSETFEVPSGDAFVSADYYIDESMPSSMTDLSCSRKVRADVVLC